MGTRNLTCVWLDGEPKVAQYCQWDGYPEGQGLTALRFLKSNFFYRPALEAQVRRLIEPDEEIMKTLYAEVGHDTETSNGWISFDKAQEFKSRWPHLHRDFGANILEYVQRLEEKPEGGTVDFYHSNEVEFAGDGLFCEWAWVVDLDLGTFECYGGFGKKKLLKREKFAKYAKPVPDPLPYADYQHYQPIRLLAFWKLDELRNLDEATFIKVCTEGAEKPQPQWGRQLATLTKEVGAPGVLVTK